MQDQDYKRKIKFNAVTSYINLFFNSAILLLISPLLVRFLGDVHFGVWKSVQRILSITSVADGRSTQALKSFISNLESDNDEDKKKRLLGSALRVSLYFLPLTVIVVGVVVFFLPGFINELPPDIYNTVYLAGFILGLNIILGPLLGIADSVLVGTNNIYKLNVIQTFTTILMNGLFLLSSFLGYGILGLALVSTFILILNGVIVFLICKKNISWFGLKKPKPEEIKQFFKFSFWIFIWVFVERLFLSTEIFLIGYLISPIDVTNFSFSSYTIQLGVTVALLTGTSFTPSLGKFMGARDSHNSLIVLRNIKMSLRIISIVFGLGIVLFNELFVELWVGTSYYLGDFNNYLMVIIMVQLFMFRNDSQIQDLTLNIKSKVITGLVASILVFTVSIIAYQFYPSISVIFISIFVSRLVMTIVFRFQVNRHFKIAVEFKDEIMVFMLITLTYVIFHFFIIENNFIFKTLYYILILGFLYKFLGGSKVIRFFLKK